MIIRKGYAWTMAALLGAGLATAVSAQGYGNMMKGAAEDAAKEEAAGSAKQAAGGGAAAGDTGSGAAAGDTGTGAPRRHRKPAAPRRRWTTMGRVNSAGSAGAGAAAPAAMGGNYKGAAQQGGQAAMDDWKKTGAGPIPEPVAPALAMPRPAVVPPPPATMPRPTTPRQRAATSTKAPTKAPARNKRERTGRRRVARCAQPRGFSRAAPCGTSSRRRRRRDRGCAAARPWRPSTWRLSASPRSCQLSSAHCARPVAPSGWPLEIRPPDGLTTTLPP